MANPLSAYDAICETDACRAQGLPQVLVSLSDLSLLARVVDLSLDGGAPALSLERLWTQEAARGSFGDRWVFNLDEALIIGEDSTVTLRRASGRIDRFAIASGSTSYFALTGATDTLTRAADGSYALAYGVAGVKTFGATGKLLSIKEGAATVATFEYDASGRLATARSRGLSLRFEYDGGGRIASIADGAGRTVRFAYSAEGRLTTQTNPDGASVSYQYNDQGLLTRIARDGATVSIEYRVDESYVSVASITLPDGSVRRYDTPRGGREIRVQRGDGAWFYTSNALGLVDSVTDSAGNRTTFVYDGAGRRTRVVNAENETTRFEYDGGGALTALVDGAGNRWTADIKGGLVHDIVNPVGPVWSFGYENGALTAVAPPAGAVASAERNASGAVTRLNRYGVASSYQYTSDGLVRQYTDPAGAVWTYEYDGAGRVVARADASGETIRAEYGAGLRPVAYTAGGSRAGASESGVERDALGRLTRYTDSFGNQLTYSWSAAGRLSRMTLPGDRSVTYEYDRDGLLTKVADSAGNFALYRYDAAGAPISVNVSGGPVTVFQYDDSRSLKAVISTGPDGEAVAGYRYSADGAGNRIGVSALEPYAKTFSFADRSYGYNAAGRAVSRGGASYHYDARGALTSVEGGPNYGFSYDAFGRLRAVSGDANASFSYDNLGLRVSRAGASSRRFVYDLSGARPRPVLETDASGAVVAWYVYGATLLWKVTADGKAYFYHYDGDGNTVALTNPAAGVVNRYRYDALGRMVASEEGVENGFRARGAAGVIDDGDGLLYADGQYVMPELRVTLPGAIDIRPPSADLTPPLPAPGMCLWRGVAACPLAGARRQQ